jgi:hypothetical protein
MRARLLAIPWAVSLLAACGANKPPVDSQKPPVDKVDDADGLDPEVKDVPNVLPGNPPSIRAAAAFAWREFIALNRPALKDGAGNIKRDTGEMSGNFGRDAAEPIADKPPLAWESFRHKVEIYPGSGSPHGALLTGSPGSFQVQGYDDPPQYVYKEQYKPCPDADPTLAKYTPWVNLDENSQIGLNNMFAGKSTVGGPHPPPGDGLFLFMAKANRVHFDYVLNPDNSGGTKLEQAFWNHTDPRIAGSNNLSGNPFFDLARYNFSSFVYKKILGQPAKLEGKRVNFPAGMIEVKSAWRRLTKEEMDSKTFHVALVRYYDSTTAGGTCYRQEFWGLAALHIIQKTANQPYFVFATFEQAGNLQVPGPDGKPRAVETPTGARNPEVLDPGPALATGLNPPLDNLSITPATPNAIEQYNTAANKNIVNCSPGPRLHYQNTPNETNITPQGTICVNQRSHPIPSQIEAVNANAQRNIAYHDTLNHVSHSPWRYYKLINVQFVPLDKSAGKTEYSENVLQNSMYYMANSVVETNYNLQHFSGRLVEPKGQLMSDYNPEFLAGWSSAEVFINLPGDGDGRPLTLPLKPLRLNQAQQQQPFKNTYYIKNQDGSDAESFNMGGCMGCHGNTQIAGTDFSFILSDGRNDQPDTTDPGISRYRRLGR